MVQERAENDAQGNVKWNCLCDCGKTHEVSGIYLRDGRSRSCGCYKRESTSGRFRKHGMSNTRFHNSWREMIRRCNDEGSMSYEDYGGRGIQVCTEWAEFDSFTQDMYESFLGHADEHGEDNTTLDRIDTDGDYTPSNCRWATYDIQVRNRRVRRDSTTGVTGISPHGDGRYRVRIKVDRVSKHIGLFEDFDEAVASRKEAEERYWETHEMEDE